MDVTIASVLAIAFLATFIRSTFGFGEALVAVPLLALVMPIKTAAPLAVLLSITVAALVLLQDWRHVHVSSAGWLLAPTLLGIPIGIWLLRVGHQSVVRAVLGLLILVFAIYSILGEEPPELRSEGKAWPLASGLLAGILGGAYGMNGPPLVVYGAMKRWSPQQFRATLQGYFLPASLFGMAGYWLSGLWQPAVTRYYLISLTVSLPAILLGRLANQRLGSGTFLKVVYYGLAGAGIILLVQSLAASGS